MLLATLAALLAAWSGGLGAAVLVAFAVGFSANTAKLAFDSIVQRDAPDANRGRSFAKFETRFQIFWVVGAFIPVVLPPPGPLRLPDHRPGGRIRRRHLLDRPAGRGCRPAASDAAGARAARPAHPGKSGTEPTSARRPTARSWTMSWPFPIRGSSRTSSRPVHRGRRRPDASEPDARRTPGARPRSPPPQPRASPEHHRPTREPPGASRRRRPTQRDPRLATSDRRPIVLAPDRGAMALESGARTVGSGRSMRASQRPGASTSAGVGSSRSPRQRRSRPRVPARSTTPATKVSPRSHWSWVSSRPSRRSTKRLGLVGGRPAGGGGPRLSIP